MSMRRAEHDRIHHAVEREIIKIAPLAGQKTQILPPLLGIAITERIVTAVPRLFQCQWRQFDPAPFAVALMAGFGKLHAFCPFEQY